MKLPARLVLPDPRITCRESDPAVVAHLEALNARIQDYNRMVRDELAANRKSGVLVWDDGVNYKITVTFSDGVVTTAPVVAASSGVAGASWT